MNSAARQLVVPKAIPGITAGCVIHAGGNRTAITLSNAVFLSLMRHRFSIGMVLWYFFAVKPEGTETTLGELIALCQVPLLIAVSFFAWSFTKSQNAKPIYDRWVMQHGTDPDKWPDATKPD